MVTAKVCCCVYVTSPAACTSRGASKATDVLSAYQTMSYKPYHACLFRAWDTEVSRPLYDNRVIAVSGSVFRFVC